MREQYHPLFVKLNMKLVFFTLAGLLLLCGCETIGLRGLWALRQLEMHLS